MPSFRSQLPLVKHCYWDSSSAKRCYRDMPLVKRCYWDSPLVKRCYWDSPLVKRCYSQARCDSYVPCMCPRLYTACGIENEPDTGERPSRVYNHFTRRKIKHKRVRVSKIHERPNSGSPKKTIGGEQSRLIVPLATFD